MPRFVDRVFKKKYGGQSVRLVPHQDVTLGEDPIAHGLMVPTGGYVPAPYVHPWTGNLVYVPNTTRNPILNAFNSSAIFAGQAGSFQASIVGSFNNTLLVLPSASGNTAPLLAGTTDLMTALSQFKQSGGGGETDNG